MTIRGQGEKFLAQPTTDLKLGTSGRRVGTWTGAGVTATLGLCLFERSPYSTAACPEFHIDFRLGRELFILPNYLRVTKTEIHYVVCNILFSKITKIRARSAQCSYLSYFFFINKTELMLTKFVLYYIELLLTNNGLFL